MKISLDAIELGQAHDAESLSALLSAEQFDAVVCTRIDGVDTTLDDLLSQSEWQGEMVDLYTFDGWMVEAANQVKRRLDDLRPLAGQIAVMAGDRNPIELLDELMNKPKAIIAELVPIKEHLGSELAAMIDEVHALMVGAEGVITTAVRSKDFVCLADVIRFEWSLALRGLLSFLDPNATIEMPFSEASPTMGEEEMFERNLKVVAERFSTLDSQIRTSWQERDEERYAIDEGPSGLRAPRVNGHRMWSVIEPAADLERIAKEHAGDAAPERWDSAVTWGVPGNLAHTLLETEMEKRPQIYVRPDLAAFAAELHCVDWTELIAAHNTLLCPTVDTFRWTLRNCFVHKDQTRRLSSPNLLQVDPALYVELHEESGHTELSLAMEGHTGSSRGRQWTANALANVATLLSEPDVHCMKDLRKGMPGILVAPGPSLAKNIHLIPEFAQKGVVVGVSHVLGKLQKLGVDPELIVAIEANDISDHFKHTDPSRTSIFLHESTHPNVVAQPTAQRWVVHDGEIGRRLREDDSLKPVNMVASSCTHIAMWALKEMGCDPIVFVGLDLALEDGRQYSEGCEGWTPSQQTLEVEGYHGERVQTLAQYNVFRDQFELCIGHKLFSDRTYINATEGGARIRGAEQKTLAEVIEDIKPLTNKEHHGALMAPDEHLPKLDWSKVLLSLESSITDMSDAEESASKGLRSARAAIKCFKAGDEAGMHRRARAAAKRAKRANEVLTDDHVFNGRWMAEQNKRSQRFEREATYLSDNPKALMRHNLAHYQQLLASILEAAQSLRPLYEDAVKRVRDQHHV